jgi:hypothetical protein
MRDIKFRAWYRKEKKMYDVQLADGGEHDNAVERWAGEVFEWQDQLFDVMQFTGHQSIDGIDVYEGDFLKFPGSDDQHYLVKWLEDTGQWGIMFGPKVFGLQMGTIGLTQFMQVVGNVYENEELL